MALSSVAYHTRSPALFIIFNRPKTTAQVFEAIRAVKPGKLYVAADGPRKSKAGEEAIVAETRRIVSTIDWDCEVKTLFREENLGCKRSVSSAISWFFENEEQGIILEDDCLPHEDFFKFCDELLEKYKTDERVAAITGCNFQYGNVRGDSSYYFSKYNHVWGWASWRRAWAKYDLQMNFWPVLKNSDQFAAVNPDKIERKYWQKIFDKMHANEIDTWDYAWTASLWCHGGLTATPNTNLISNIGFGADATHTLETACKFANMKTEPICPILHPSVVSPEQNADKFVFDDHFGGRDMRFPRNICRISRRVVNYSIRKFINFSKKF